MLPEKLLYSLSDLKGYNKEPFSRAHTSGDRITSVRLNPAKACNIQQFTSESSLIPWTVYGYYLASRPSFTFDPLFHAGCYYVQEASSMFLEQALTQTIDLTRSLKVLDLCAAPGGKSTHIQSLISKESLLVSNEVIRSRANILKDNIIKWGCENIMVTNNDPKDFAKLENYFDVIVVDAPCSGSGLFRREPEAVNEWSENNVQLCSQRQQRILADVWPALKKDGILIYSTCSYSKEEDEDIFDWLQQAFTAQFLPLVLDPVWGITDTGKGYRFWPDKVRGEGFFLACFQKKEGEGPSFVNAKRKPVQLSKSEKAIAAKWVNAEGKELIKHENTVYVWPVMLFNDLSFLLAEFRVVYSGVLAGELVRDKLVPGHPLAMSNCIQGTVPATALTAEKAVRYLQRREFHIEAANSGWQLVTYQQHALGWINVLANRVNNYYPKELRILKDN